MLVKELIKKLENFNGDLEIITERFSDYTKHIAELYIMEGVDKGGWVQRPYPYADGSDQRKIRDFVVIEGEA